MLIAASEVGFVFCFGVSAGFTCKPLGAAGAELTIYWSSPIHRSKICGSGQEVAASNTAIFIDTLIGTTKWVDQPYYRGTFDILWTSLVTIFISTYTMLCLNVPSPKDSYLKLVGRRLLWMCLGIMGPEFPLTYAAGQWSRAKHSVAAFRASGYEDWHLRQAFFADMGGFVFHARDGEPSPLNATQLHWLVINEFVQYPSITKKDVWDRSKQDTFTKVVTTFQIGYLIIQCIARAIQGLVITTLELNAVAIVIYSSYSISEITRDRQWKLTPLDFIDENGPGYSVNVQPFMKMPVIPSERPIQRIPNDRFPMNPYGSQEYLLCLATLVFIAIHVAGWNFDFPTHTERILWRISSMLLFGIAVAFWGFETVASWIRLGRWKQIYLFVFDRKALDAHKRRTMQRAATVVKREMAQLPLPWEFAAITPLAIVYGIARSSAYINVEWIDFIPHV
ncbi:hypothetical protein EJ04DRAFT_588566 [Polyplosphaeria fusca]|uniref:Odorant receptor n=1 Tax=Polyplosphaeria fusca TaxID=682080 RepID=A0A9P4QNF5_9PLEO|nr:hypothetical protein EJ04DRAFT_588566 [Polyplosphaeria fusca]